MTDSVTIENTSRNEGAVRETAPRGRVVSFTPASREVSFDLSLQTENSSLVGPEGIALNTHIYAIVCSSHANSLWIRIRLSIPKLYIWEHIRTCMPSAHQFTLNSHLFGRPGRYSLIWAHIHTCMPSARQFHFEFASVPYAAYILDYYMWHSMYAGLTNIVQQIKMCLDLNATSFNSD